MFPCPKIPIGRSAPAPKTLPQNDLTNSTWEKVSYLSIGDEIATADGFKRIVSIKQTGRKQVYDIEVRGAHNFVGNGVVAHNTTGIMTRAGAGALQNSTSGSNDIQIAAEDRPDLFAASYSLTADGYIDTQQKFIASDVKVDLRAETYKRLMNELNLPIDASGTGSLRNAPQLTEVSQTSVSADTISASVAEVLSALAGKLDKADQRISTLEDQQSTQEKLDTNGNIQEVGQLTLTTSQELPAFSSDSSGYSSVLGSLTIGGNLTIGLLTIDDLNASINSMGETLKLQNLGLADIEFMGGKVTIDTAGNLKVEGEITAEKVTAEEVETKRLCIEDICVTRDELERLLEKNESN